jgi:hypothetical protein
VFERIEPDHFGWDRSAKDPKLLDSEYFFEDGAMSATTIFERYQNISPAERKAIEEYAVIIRVLIFPWILLLPGRSRFIVQYGGIVLWILLDMLRIFLVREFLQE